MRRGVALRGGRLVGDVEGRAVDADDLGRRSVSPVGVARIASIVQYSRAVNASISRSRSTTRRTATDWTRPADRPPRTLRDRSGLSV